MRHHVRVLGVPVVSPADDLPFHHASRFGADRGGGASRGVAGVPARGGADGHVQLFSGVRHGAEGDIPFADAAVVVLDTVSVGVASIVWHDGRVGEHSGGRFRGGGGGRVHAAGAIEKVASNIASGLLNGKKLSLPL